MPASDLPPLSPRGSDVQAALDADHLRLLEIGFYISALMTGFRFLWFLFMAFFFAIVGLSAALAKAPTNHPPSGGPPPAIFFVVFAGVFAIVIFLTLVFAGLELYAGVCFRNRRHPIFVQIIAAFYCLSIPWGTALGVFTFVVMNRPSVRILFKPT